MIQELFKPKPSDDIKRDSFDMFFNKTLKNRYHMITQANNDEFVYITGKALSYAEICKKLHKFCSIKTNELRLVGYVFIDNNWRESYWKKDGTHICSINGDEMFDTKIIPSSIEFNIDVFPMQYVKKLNFESDYLTRWVNSNPNYRVKLEVCVNE